MMNNKLNNIFFKQQYESPIEKKRNLLQRILETIHSNRNSNLNENNTLIKKIYNRKSKIKQFTNSIKKRMNTIKNLTTNRKKMMTNAVTRTSKQFMQSLIKNQTNLEHSIQQQLNNLNTQQVPVQNTQPIISMNIKNNKNPIQPPRRLPPIEKPINLIPKKRNVKKNEAQQNIKRLNVFNINKQIQKNNKKLKHSPVIKRISPPTELQNSNNEFSPRNVQNIDINFRPKSIHNKINQFVQPNEPPRSPIEKPINLIPIKKNVMQSFKNNEAKKNIERSKRRLNKNIERSKQHSQIIPEQKPIIQPSPELNLYKQLRTTNQIEHKKNVSERRQLLNNKLKLLNVFNKSKRIQVKNEINQLLQSDDNLTKDKLNQMKEKIKYFHPQNEISKKFTNLKNKFIMQTISDKQKQTWENNQTLLKSPNLLSKHAVDMIQQNQIKKNYNEKRIYQFKKQEVRDAIELFTSYIQQLPNEYNPLKKFIYERIDVISENIWNQLYLQVFKEINKINKNNPLFPLIHEQWEKVNHLIIHNFHNHNCNNKNVKQEFVNSSILKKEQVQYNPKRFYTENGTDLITQTEKFLKNMKYILDSNIRTQFYKLLKIIDVCNWEEMNKNLLVLIKRIEDESLRNHILCKWTNYIQFIQKFRKKVICKQNKIV